MANESRNDRRVKDMKESEKIFMELLKDLGFAFTEAIRIFPCRLLTM